MTENKEMPKGGCEWSDNTSRTGMGYCQFKDVCKAYRNEVSKQYTINAHPIDYFPSDCPIKQKEQDKWHTNTPTEEGWYLYAVRHYDLDMNVHYSYHTQWYDKELGWNVGGVVAWMPIEPYKED